jgi:hypothetical protein
VSYCALSLTLVLGAAGCGSSGFAGGETDELTLNFMGFTGEGIVQADLVGTTTADVDVCPTVCEVGDIFIDFEIEEFTSTRAFALFLNVGFADILLDKYVVSNPGSGLPDRIVDTAVIIPSGRCSNNPARHCASNADCQLFGSCDQTETPIEILLFDFIDKELLVDPGPCDSIDPETLLIIPGNVLPRRFQTNVTFYASDESGERFTIQTGLSGQFADFNNCDASTGGM